MSEPPITPVKKRQPSLFELWDVESPKVPQSTTQHKKLLASPSHNTSISVQKFYESLEAIKREQLAIEKDIGKRNGRGEGEQEPS